MAACHLTTKDTKYTKEDYVGQRLGLMNALDFNDTFQFDDQLVLDENFDSVSTIEVAVYFDGTTDQGI